MKKSSFDIKIIIFFVSIFLLVSIFFIYRFFNRVDCEDAKFFIVSDHFQNEESVEFKDKTENASSWKWDFGDKTPTDNRQHTLHKYKDPGTYVATLTINGECVHTKNIVITDRFASDKAEMARIVVQKVITVGQPVLFQGVKDGGKTWEWSFGESSKTDETSQNPVYVFKSSGYKTITLVTNGMYKSVAKKVIFVHAKEKNVINPLGIEAYVYQKNPKSYYLPKGSAQPDPLDDFLKNIPVAATSETVNDSLKAIKQAPKISEDKFETLIEKVAGGSLIKDDFAEYLCNNFDIPVIKNDDELITFAELCESLKGKKIKIITTRLKKDKKTNCIIGIDITYQVKKYLVWVKE
jgi:PKD repeat protein